MAQLNILSHLFERESTIFVVEFFVFNELSLYFFAVTL